MEKNDGNVPAQKDSMILKYNSENLIPVLE